MKSRFGVEVACVALSVFAALPAVYAAPPNAGRASKTGLAGLPASMQPAISATLGREDARYLARTIDEGFRLGNPGQGISAELTPAGARFANSGANWQMKLTAYGYGENMTPASAASIEAKDNRVDYRRGSMTEWYVNGPLGVEQGFTFGSRPARSEGAPLTVKVALSGNVTAKIDAATNSLMLASNGVETLRYSGLSAYDSKGVSLKSWMELRGSNLLLHVDDRGAQYPVTVDPYVQTAILSSAADAGALSGDQFGYTVAFNNDYAVVGAPYYNSAQGVAYVFKSPTAATTTYTAKLTASDGTQGDGFGTDVSIGTDDTIAVGAPFVNVFTGAVYVFTVPAGGYKTTAAFSAKLTAYDGTSGDGLGYSVGVGDHIIAAGAPGYPNGDFKGSAVVYNNPTGSTAYYTGVRQVDKANIAGDSFGWRIAAYQYSDVVSTPFPNNITGAAYVYDPKPLFKSTYTAKFTTKDGVAGDAFGNDVAVDGTSSDPATIVVGAPFNSPKGGLYRGAAYIYSRVGATWKSTNTSTAKITSSDTVDGDGFGYSVALKNGVLLIGAPGNNNFTGKGYVYNQPGAGWASTSTPADTLFPVPAVAGEYFGWSAFVAPSGGLLLGAPYRGTNGIGNAYVYTSSGPLPGAQGK